MKSPKDKRQCELLPWLHCSFHNLTFLFCLVSSLKHLEWKLLFSCISTVSQWPVVVKHVGLPMISFSPSSRSLDAALVPSIISCPALQKNWQFHMGNTLVGHYDTKSIQKKQINSLFCTIFCNPVILFCLPHLPSPCDTAIFQTELYHGYLYTTGEAWGGGYTIRVKANCKLSIFTCPSALFASMPKTIFFWNGHSSLVGAPVDCGHGNKEIFTFSTLRPCSSMLESCVSGQAEFA